MRRLAVLLLMLAVVVVGAGCGSVSGSGDAAAPATGAAPTAATAAPGSTNPPPPGVRPSAGCASVSGSRSTDAPNGGGTTPGGVEVPDLGVPVEVRTTTVDGVERHAFVARPDRPAGEPVPLVLAFHGHGSGAGPFAELTDLAARGTAAGMLVAVPQGQAKEDGKSTWAITGGGADAAYVDALLAELGRDECIDLARVYFTGFSAGAAFTIAYTCRHQDQIAAIATVAVDFQLGCKQPQSILALHGTADIAVAYQDGGQGLSLPGTKVRGTEQNLADWAALAGCDPTPTETNVGTEVVHRVWSGCQEGTGVELYTVIGGAHAWPGANPSRAIGLTTQQVSATDEALRFFAAHHR